MKVPLSWVKDFVEIDTPIEDLAYRLTMAGLEVEEIHYVGLPIGEEADHSRETKTTGIEWDREKIVVAAILEVMPHPNADRLVLCRLDDGQTEQTVLTGAPNLFDYKGTGPLETPLKVAYAKEGARIYDGHQPGQVLTTLKRAKIRGVESYSMVCSEKELGISDEHEGIIILDEDAPVGMPLVDYMGDAVFDIAITPNIARDANILGVAREVAALTGRQLTEPDFSIKAEGPSIEGKVSIEINEPELNPRFVLGLIQDVQIRPSPYWVQRRLRLAGMRPINNIVDTTNYVMLEVGEPLHAFDYDVLVERAGGQSPTILTRRAKSGERLTTLDDVDRPLDDFTVLVCDTDGALSIAGVMGGAESEVGPQTRDILLEGAAWNFINIRQTVASQRLQSEAAYRFSRGVHPAMAKRGVSRCLEFMRQWSHGVVSRGLVDEYPLPPEDATVEITPADVRRWLGIELSVDQIAGILHRLGFKIEVNGQQLSATTPDHRLDIETGIHGVADLMEEVARIYGYDRIPETRLSAELPPQRSYINLEREERVRDLLVGLGLQEVITYRLTSQEREARRFAPNVPADDKPYITLANPIASDRNVLRHSLLASMLEVVERNARLRERMALFEIGPVFLASEEGVLPDEVPILVLALTGKRDLPAWQGGDPGTMDFYDLKGILDALFSALHLEGIHYEPSEHPSFHPGKCARILLDGQHLGTMGALHPLVREHYELPDTPLLAAECNLQTILNAIQDRFNVEPVPSFPPALEDLAIIVDENIPGAQVEEVIRKSGGSTLSKVRLFDVYRGEQIGAGLKSLAYSLTYQATDHTLADKEVLSFRQRIIRRLEQELGARLRS